ncbi:hypothetical protein DL96DRAFT_1470257 [Flagelloscypha sp. PMI_526]|nr:hypothetical protein DL96DRAFT_1470257 [Flagelloscypha sp. PMI_526]
MSSTESTPHTVLGEIVFNRPPPNEQNLWIRNDVDATGKRPRNWKQEPHMMPIEDWRGSDDIFLDTAGFQLVSDVPTQHIKDGEIDVENYRTESIELIKRVTGACNVVLFDHTIRRREKGLEDSPGNRQPVSDAHVDQTPIAAAGRVKRHMPASEVPTLLSKRYQIINLWRPISNPAWDWPLALCDFRSVDQRDVLPITLIYPDREGQTYSIKHNASQRWGYFRGMKPDECVLFKCFDSKRDVAHLVPHAAFSDSSAPEDAPLRESIELRALVFYD